jgi:anti-anti-sigma factor
MGDLFRYTRVDFDGQAVTRLGGELDLSAHGDLHELLDEMIDVGKDDVVLDVADLTFMDVRAVRICCEAAEALRERGGRLIVEHASPLIRRLFTLAGTDAVTFREPNAV